MTYLLWFYAHPTILLFAAVGFLISCIFLRFVLSRLFHRGGYAATDLHFATTADLRRVACYGREGVVLGRRRFRTLRYDGEGNLIFIGRPRSGKTATILSTLLEWPGALLLWDPKDALWPKIASFRSFVGPTLRYAPLDDVTDFYDPLQAVRMGTHDAFHDARLVAEMLVNPEGEQPKSDAAIFYQGRAKAILTGMILFGLDAEQQTSLPEIREALLHLKWSDIASAMEQSDIPSVRDTAQVMKRLTKQALGGVQLTVSEALEVFSDPRVARLVTTSTQPLGALRAQPPATVCLTIPFSDHDRLRPLFQIILRQHLNYAMSKLRGWEYPLLVVMEELPSLGYCPWISGALNFCTEYGVHFLLITPSMEEIVHDYGQHHNFLESTAVQVLFGVNDPYVAERFAKRIGKTLVSDTQVQKLPEKKVLIIANDVAALVKQARYFAYRPWRTRVTEE